MRALQRTFLFPRFVVRAEPGAGDDVRGLVRLSHPSPEGPVEAWLLPGDGVSAASPGPAVLFAHGNGELIEHWPEMLDPYRRAGVSVFLPEFRGYGRSAGTPSEVAIREDFLAFHTALTARPEVDARRVILHGRSLGGGAVCTIARERPPAALVLQSTFTSVADVAKTWGVPSSWITDRFESLPVVRDAACPVLVLHGRRDRVVPFPHGESLARANPRARFVAYDCDHNDFPPDEAAYWRDVLGFLREASVLG